MKNYIAAFALTAALAQPASAITFPSLTTIYVGSGVYDDGSVTGVGEATAIHCSNVSGVGVQVRVLVLDVLGAVAGSETTSLAHGRTVSFSTHRTVVYFDSASNLETGSVLQGVVNVEATNSAVFCTAVVLDAANEKPVYMSPLHLVRVNPHPGTVE
jgi:hypothetical protein